MSSKSDDVLYLAVLGSSIAGALLSRHARHGVARQLIVGVGGLLLTMAVCRWHALYSLTLCLINIALIKTVGLASFAASFAFLVVFRCSEWFYLPTPYKHANAVQLLMTLKVIGVAFELQDSHAENAKAQSAARRGFRAIARPSTFDLLVYYYNLCGLFTGPYYSFKTHQDCMHNPIVDKIPVAHEITPRLAMAPFYILLCLAVQTYFPLEYLRDDAFYTETSLLYRLMYMTPTFYYLKTRVYTAWMLSEACCMLAGLGAYHREAEAKCAHGVTKLDRLETLTELGTNPSTSASSLQAAVDYTTVTNVAPYACEFSDGFRSGMRAWNMSVQYWLATHIYHRTPRAYRTSLTMLVSAYWHGVHPGYYLSFLTVPLCTYAEDLLFRRREHRRHNKFIVVSWWFIRTKGFEYMSCGFLLLTYTDTMRYWASTYYMLHTVLIVLIPVMLVANHFEGVDAKKKEL